MNLKTFEELISDPELLNKDTQSELEQLLKEYPFCQTFHLLYTKNLFQLKHIRYQQQLKVAAAFVGDRTRLKHYVEDSPLIISVKSEPSTGQVEIPVETKIEIEEVPSRISSSVEWDADYESVLSSSINVEVSREERKKAIIALIDKKFNERLAITADKPVDPSPVSEIPLIVKTEEVSQTLKQEEMIPSTDLIEKFLRDAPRMPRPRKEFYNPVNLAARSIEENEDFYTETYAYICLKQGNAAKAIKIYEKLSLKFPEKSSYFAGLIEKIKKEQNI
jgi:tetratricopeptide (TPR) repeat protein